MELTKLFDFVVSKDWDSWDYGPAFNHQGYTLVFGGANPQILFMEDYTVLYYKKVYFICTRQIVAFFEKEKLTDFLCGTLDECWCINTRDFEFILDLEEAHTSEYALPATALKTLMDVMTLMPKDIRVLE